MDPQLALARLRDPDGDALDGLAGLVIGSALDTPWGEVVDAAWIAEQAVRALDLIATSPRARALALSAAHDARGALHGVHTTPRAAAPVEVVDSLRALLQQPWSPSEELTFRLINHPALRAMLKEVLTGSLTRFAERMRSVDQGVLGGLGGRVARRGAGLFGGGLGAAAESLVGAVRDEVEAALEGRIRDFVGQATEEAVRTIARWLADPQHADVLASMRVAAADALLDTPTARLAAEGDGLDPERIADVLEAAGRALARRPGFAAELQPAIQRALQEVAGETLGAWLDAASARDAWTDALRPVVRARLLALVRTEAFAAWWLTLSH